MTCPRCGSALEEGDFGGVPLHLCSGCLGALVVQRDLVKLLDVLSADLAREMSFDHPIEPIADHGGDAACPRCGRTMETGGYMESNLVMIDRCRSCWVLWTDPEELGVMAVLYARTNHRSGVREKEFDEWQRGLNRRVGALLVARARGNAVATAGARFGYLFFDD